MLGTQGTDIPALQVTTLGLLPSHYTLWRPFMQREALPVAQNMVGVFAAWVGASASPCSMQGSNGQ